jgi:hypothetical protein
MHAHTYAGLAERLSIASILFQVEVLSIEASARMVMKMSMQEKDQPKSNKDEDRNQVLGVLPLL